MEKETEILTANYIMESNSLTEGALRAYTFITEMDKSDPAFVDTRSALSDEFKDLWKYMRWCERVAESIKKAMRSAMEVAEDDLPKGVSWSKVSFQSKFTDGVSAAKAIAERCGKDIALFTATISPTQAMKIASIGEDELTAIVGDNYVKTPKARTLNVK